MQQVKSISIFESQNDVSTSGKKKQNSDKIKELTKEMIAQNDFFLRCDSQTFNRPDHELFTNVKVSFLNQLKKMSDTPLKEQLHDLLLLCNLKKKTPSDKILSLSFNLAKTPELLTVSDLRLIVGKLIYLVNQNMDEINSALNGKSVPQQIQQTTDLFEQKINEISSSLLKFMEKHKKGMLQDQEKALSVQIPIVLANALISDSGYVNIGIIEPLMHRFLSNKRKMPFEKNIAFALNSIKTSTHLRQKIHLIGSPFSQTLPSNDLIRITLQLPPKAITTAIDAKKTALAALISHMRQSPASSCFASFLAIEMLSQELSLCLDDFCELLQKSKLLRFTEGETKEFSFLMRSGKESTSQIIHIDKTGKIHSKEGMTCYIWKVPGIKAACNLLGIPNKKRLLQQISQDLVLKSKENIFDISISKLLKIIAHASEGDPTYNFNCAKLSFEGQLHNPLLRIWENVIASMAEATEHGKLTEALITCVIQLLSKMFGNNLLFKREITKKLRQQLIDSVRFAYDTDSKSRQLSNDGRSDRGAFILFDRNGSTNQRDWKPIENADDFKVFILNILRSSLSLKNKEVLFLEIKEYIQSDKFIIDALRVYNPANGHIADSELIKNLKSIPHTPWKDKTGNNSKEVLRIYSNTPNQGSPVILNPKNATKLLLSLIEMGRKFPTKTKKTLSDNSHYLTPLIIKGVHAFSMMFGSETLQAAFKSEKSPSDWIHENLITPGKKISDLKATHEMKNKLSFFIARNMLPKEDKAGGLKFQEKVNALANDISLSALRNHLIAIIKEISNENYYPIKTITSGIDFFIYQYILPKDAQKELTRALIHFADTNWSAGLHDVHFCFIYNAGSAAIEIWEAYEDGTGLYPISQEDWMTKQTWEI